jgi:hypothetical protein
MPLEEGLAMDIIAATHALSSAEPRRSHRATGRAVQSQLSQFLINAWLRHQERRVERAVLALDHQGVTDDFWQALKNGR